jgi:S1-C subfamily serine protease
MRHTKKTLGVILGSVVAASICVAAEAGERALEANSEETVVALAQADASKSDRAWVGIYFETVNSRNAAKLGYPHETGIIVSMVIPGSPADKHGIKDGDVVYSFGGVVVENAEHFGSLVMERRANETVPVVIFRKGAGKTVNLRLGGRADRSDHLLDLGRTGDEAFESFEKAFSLSKGSALRIHLMRGRVGILLRDLNADLAAHFGVEKNEGVLVLDVEKASPAEKAGIKSGDVIVRVNGDPVADASAAAEAISAVEPGDTVSFDVLRKGARRAFDVAVEAGPADALLRMKRIEGGALDAEAAEKIRRQRGDDPEKLRQEIEALKSRVRDLEERLKAAEKR